MYPVASMALMSPNKTMICGTKMTMPPNPLSKPSRSRLLHHVAGIISIAVRWTQLNPASTTSMGYADQA